MYDARYLQRLTEEFSDIDENMDALESFLRDCATPNLADWKTSFKNTAKCSVSVLREQLGYMNGYRECLRNRIVAHLNGVSKD